jgi:transposase
VPCPVCGTATAKAHGYHHRAVKVRQVSQVTQELCGRAAARLAGLLTLPVYRRTALRRLRRLSLPGMTVPRVIGVDDFALRRRQRYATTIIDAQTGRRVAVLPGRDATTPESWPREHPWCRGGVPGRLVLRARSLASGVGGVV